MKIILSTILLLSLHQAVAAKNLYVNIGYDKAPKIGFNGDITEHITLNSNFLYNYSRSEINIPEYMTPLYKEDIFSISSYGVDLSVQYNFPAHNKFKFAMGLHYFYIENYIEHKYFVVSTYGWIDEPVTHICHDKGIAAQAKLTYDINKIISIYTSTGLGYFLGTSIDETNQFLTDYKYFDKLPLAFGITIKVF